MSLIALSFPAINQLRKLSLLFIGLSSHSVPSCFLLHVISVN